MYIPTVLSSFLMPNSFAKMIMEFGCTMPSYKILL